MLRAQAIAKCLKNCRDDEPSLGPALSIAKSMSRLVIRPGWLSMARASASSTQAIFFSVARE